MVTPTALLAASLTLLGATYGTPTPSPYWSLQTTNDCLEQSTRIALDQTGHTPMSETRIDTYATKIGMLTPAGSDPTLWPTLLHHYGINTTPAGMSRARLDADLSKGNAVVAVVNAETLWKPLGYSTTIPTTAADHALVVKADLPYGPVLIDTGIPLGNGYIVSWAEFSKAWSASSYEAVVIP